MAVSKCIGGERAGKLCVGNLVLARYTVDDKVYRAKIEEVFDNGVYSVRYIDYGTRGDNLTVFDIYPWVPALEIIPPQAVLCCFADSTFSTFHTSSLSLKEMYKFRLIMVTSCPMQMTIHKRLVETSDVWNPSLRQEQPEVTVSLKDRKNREVSKRVFKWLVFDSNLREKRDGDFEVEDVPVSDVDISLKVTKTLRQHTVTSAGNIDVAKVVLRILDKSINTRFIRSPNTGGISPRQALFPQVESGGGCFSNMSYGLGSSEACTLSPNFMPMKKDMMDPTDSKALIIDASSTDSEEQIVNTNMMDMMKPTDIQAVIIDASSTDSEE